MRTPPLKNGPHAVQTSKKWPQSKNVVIGVKNKTFSRKKWKKRFGEGNIFFENYRFRVFGKTNKTIGKVSNNGMNAKHIKTWLNENMPLNENS